MSNDAFPFCVGLQHHKRFYYFLLPDSLRKYEKSKNVWCIHEQSLRLSDCHLITFRNRITSITSTISNKQHQAAVESHNNINTWLIELPNRITVGCFFEQKIFCIDSNDSWKLKYNYTMIQFTTRLRQRCYFGNVT